MDEALAFIVGGVTVTIVVVVAIMVWGQFHQYATQLDLPAQAQGAVESANRSFWTAYSLLGILGAIGLISFFILIATILKGG